jgi:futalosine hydrolase
MAELGRAGCLLVHAAPGEAPPAACGPAHTLGVGKVAAAVRLHRLLAEHGAAVRFVLLCGVAGAYPERHRSSPPRVAPGNVCVVGQDGFGDEGVLTESGFWDFGRAGPQGPAFLDSGPFALDAELAAAAAARLGAPIVAGTTVSTCSGAESLSAAVCTRTHADVETMEGAAAAFVCREFGVPLLQVRAISNWTGDRARGTWDFAGAMRALHGALVRLFV